VTHGYELVGNGWCQDAQGRQSSLCRTIALLNKAEVPPSNNGTCSKFRAEGRSTSEMTLKEATTICSEEPECAGFTYGGESNDVEYWTSMVRLSGEIAGVEEEQGLQCWKKS